MNNPQIVLRKIGGQFGAVWHRKGSPSYSSYARSAPSLGLGGIFSALMPLLLIAFALSLAFLFGHHTMSIASAAGLSVIGQTSTEKGILDELQTAFAQFRAANDERIQKLEAKQSVDPLLESKVDKANADITRLTDELKAAQKNIREVETLHARVETAGTAESREREVLNAAKFFAQVRNTQITTPSDTDLKEYRAYRNAFSAYLRRGDSIDSDMRASLSTGSAPDGGFFLTPDTTGRIIELVFQTSVLRDLVSVQTIGTDVLEGINDLDEVSSGWVAEMDQRPNTNTPALAAAKWQIPVQEQYANPATTQKMLDDTQFDVEAWLAKKVAAKLGRVENSAFVNGNGISKPRGFMTYPAAAGKQTAANWKVISQIATGVAGGFSAKPGDCFIDLITALKVELRAGAMWAMNSTTLGAVRKLTDTQNRYLLIPDFSSSPNGTLLGYGVRELQDMPDIAAAALPIAFGNWKEAYQIVDHVVGMRTLRDPYTNKPFVQFYTTKRTGGDVLNFEALKLMKLS